MASIHAEVPNDVDIEQSMRSSTVSRGDAVKELGIFLVIHMDPVEMKDKRVLKIRDKTVQLLHDLDPACTIHDFRMVPGENQTNLIFDMVVPIDYDEKKKNELPLQLMERIKAVDPRYECVITVESDYVAQSSPRINDRKV